MFTRLIKERDEQGKILSYVLLFDGKPIPEGKKYCPACEQLLDVASFTKKGNACGPCANKRAKDWRLVHRQDPEFVKKFNKRVTDKNKTRKLEAIEFMGGACQDCGGKFPPSVYDFHHVDMATKDKNPSYVLKGGLEKAKEELAKCVLLCSNCHRIRHFEGGKNDTGKT
jgi:5-methylcytosine-specific restriction endonuclease McrA